MAADAKETWAELLPGCRMESVEPCLPAATAGGG